MARDFNISLFSAIANYLILRLNESDAKALVRNVASSDQERMLVDKIKQMDRFKALYFSEGRKKGSVAKIDYFRKRVGEGQVWNSRRPIRTGY